MLSFSRATGYAMLALSQFREQGPLVKAEDIAGTSRVPKPYLYTILKLLTKAGLIHTKRGPHGGLSLTKPPHQIRLLDVVEAIEGKGWKHGCLLGLEDCSQIAQCPTLDFWTRMREEITRQLEETTLVQVTTPTEREITMNSSPDLSLYPKERIRSMGRNTGWQQVSQSAENECLCGGGI